VVIVLTKYLAKFVAFLPSGLKYKIKGLKPIYTSIIAFGTPVALINTSAGVLRWQIDHLTSQRHLLGTYEPFMQEALRRFVRPGAVVYDVGGHVGFHSLYSALLTGRTGRVIAFEPDPEAVETLRREVAANPDLHVEIVACALSDTRGTLQLDTSTESSQARISPSGAVRVEGRTVDSLVFEGKFPRPDVMKIDVEGHEGHVLRGAATVLRECKPVVLCDYHDASTLRIVRESVSGIGYEVFPGPPITACPNAAIAGALGEIDKL
jgi:FkbM family methyltransferase